MSVTFLIILAAAHLILGAQLGRLSWYVWHNAHKGGIGMGVLAFLLFPVSFRDEEVHYRNPPPLSRGDISTRNAYVFLFALTGWITLLWAALVILGCACEAVIRFLVFGPKGPLKIVRPGMHTSDLGWNLSVLVRWPVRGIRVLMRGLVRAAAWVRRPRGLSASVWMEPSPEAELVFEHRSLQEKRAEIDARIEEIEAVPDFEKMRALHVRH